MIFIKTRSGRHLSLEHIIGFAVEEEKMEINGRKVRVFEVIAYLPQPLYPAILGIYYDESDAYENMQNLVEEILKTEKGIFQIPTDI
jgi:tRNA(Ile2) C34 agmatinyltransferase TiaS